MTMRSALSAVLVTVLMGVSSPAIAQNTMTAGPVAWDFSPSHFMENSNFDIYVANQKSIEHAWLLSFFPGLYSISAVLYTKSVADSGDEAALADYRLYLAAIPLPLGSLYAERYWEAGVIALGEAIGSALMYNYFSMGAADRRANENIFYAGLGMYAVMWIFDMFYGPIMSHRYNKTLARLYLEGNANSSESASEESSDTPSPSSESSDDSERIWDDGFYGTGHMRLSLPAPYMVGTSFTF